MGSEELRFEWNRWARYGRSPSRLEIDDAGCSRDWLASNTKSPDAQEKPASTVTALQSPTDGFVTPHDVQPIINGATYRQTLPAGEKVRVAPGAQGLVGPVGFRMD